MKRFNALSLLFVGIFFVTSVYAETEIEYKKSTNDIVYKRVSKKGVYYKKLIKSPEKFYKERLHLIGKVAEISEYEGDSFIVLFLSRNLDTVIVFSQGSIDIYENDIIEIWGECLGALSAINPNMPPWPVINAKFIALRKQKK